MDPAQIVLIVVIIILSFLFLAIGVQVFFILRELKHTLMKANKVLDDTGVITESVSKPLANLSTLATGIKVTTLIAKLLKGKRRRDDDGE